MFGRDALEQLHALVECALKSLFFRVDAVTDHRLLLPQLGIRGLHHLDDLVDQATKL